MKKNSILIIFLILFFCSLRIIVNAQSLESVFSISNINGVKVPFYKTIPYPDFHKQSFRNVLELKQWKKERQTLDHAKSIAKRDAAGLSAVEAEGGTRHIAAYNDSGWSVISVPSVENTIVYVMYDEKTFYVVFKCFKDKGNVVS